MSLISAISTLSAGLITNPLIRVPTNICEIREICVKYIANFLDSSSFSFILFYSFPFAKYKNISIQKNNYSKKCLRQ